VPEPAPAAAAGKEPELPSEPAKPEAGAAAPAAGEAPAPEQLQALTAKAQKADEYLALAQRTQADFENYRRRASREAKLAQERGAAKLALDLLPAIDNLERALAHAGDGETGADGNGTASLVAGIKHVHSDVVAALQRAGIERYSPEGERFDPQFHEAVAQQPVEGTEPGVVVEVFQRGYRIGDNVVRPARVVVAG
jgi:molecular chaperone GrpE